MSASSSSRELVPCFGRQSSAPCSPKKTNVEVFREEYCEKLEMLIHKRDQIDCSDAKNREWLDTLKGKLSFGFDSLRLLFYRLFHNKADYYVYVAEKITKLYNKSLPIEETTSKLIAYIKARFPEIAAYSSLLA